MRIDDREIEAGYARFYRGIPGTLLTLDPLEFKRYLCRFPRHVRKWSRYLGMRDEDLLVEMHKLIITTRGCEEQRGESERWLRERGHEIPRPAPTRKRERKGRRR